MNATILISAVMAAAGLIGAVVAYLKVKPERESIIIEAAKGAVIVQSTILDEMQEEVQRVKARAEELATQLQSVRDEQEKLIHERDYLRSQNEDLHKQIKTLERRVGELESNGPTPTKETP